MSSFITALINMSAAGGIVAVLVMLLRLIFRRAPKRIVLILWAIAALRLTVPFFIESPLALMPEKTAIPARAEAYLSSGYDHPRETETNTAATVIDAGHNTFSPAPAGETEAAPSETSAAPAATAATAAPAATSAPSAAAPISSSRSRRGPEPYAVVFAVWAAGCAAMLAYALISFTVLKKRLGTAVKRADGVFESDRVSTPFLLGIISPRVYIPFGMDESSLPYVLMHERSHMKNADHLWKLLGFAVLSMHWFNPLCWVAYALFCRDLELACDERVISKLPDAERAGYSEALLRLSIGRGRISACPLAFGEGDAKERIRSIARYKKPALWFTAVALLVCAVLACFAACRRQPSPEPTGTAEPTETPAPTETPTDVPAVDIFVRYPIDLDNDGSDEYIVSNVGLLSTRGQMAPYVEKDGEKLCDLETLSTADAGMISYFHTVFSGQNCLLAYRPSLGGGSLKVSYKLIRLRNGKLQIIENEEFSVSTMHKAKRDYEALNDASRIIDVLNERLACSSLIISSDASFLLEGDLIDAENGGVLDTGDAQIAAFSETEIETPANGAGVAAFGHPVTYTERFAAIDRYCASDKNYDPELSNEEKIWYLMVGEIIPKPTERTDPIYGGVDTEFGVPLRAGEDPDYSSRVSDLGELPDEYRHIVAGNLFGGARSFRSSVVKVVSVIGRPGVFEIKRYDFYGHAEADFEYEFENGGWFASYYPSDDGGILAVVSVPNSDDGETNRLELIKLSSGGKKLWQYALDERYTNSSIGCFEADGSEYVFANGWGLFATADAGPDWDVDMLKLSADGGLIKRVTLAGSGSDFLISSFPSDGGFELDLRSGSADGAFEGWEGYALGQRSLRVSVDPDLEVTDHRMITIDPVHSDVVGWLDGEPVFEDGTVTAVIDLGDHYIRVSENVTGYYPDTPWYMSSPWLYTETVYEDFSKDGDPLWRRAIDSTPDYKAMTAQYDRGN